MTPAESLPLSGRLLTLAEAFQDLLGLVNAQPADTVLDAVTQVAVAHVPGAEWATITLLTDDWFRTASATDDRARGADQLQYDDRSGPCVDAARESTLAHIRDTLIDHQWPKFSRKAAEQYSVRNVLSYRLTLEQAEETAGSLNLYALRPAAFDNECVGVRALLRRDRKLRDIAA